MTAKTKKGGGVASCPSSRPVTCTSQGFDVFLQGTKGEADLQMCAEMWELVRVGGRAAAETGVKVFKQRGSRCVWYKVNLGFN